MKKQSLTFIALIVIKYAAAQGCSDAGFCSLKYYPGTASAKNTITAGNVAGAGDGNTFINNTYITYTRQLTRKMLWDTKITANYASGTLANNFNAGDVFTNFSMQAWQSPSKKRSLNFLTGIKIPLTAGNDKAGGKPLPMGYQSSLGTVDLLLGISYVFANWEFTNAWQLPLTKQNKNTFIDEYSVSDAFPSSNKLQRKGDALLRIAYNIKKERTKFSFKPNVLAVYHLGEDSYENIFSKRQLLTGSEGLTLNANLIGKYRITASSSLELSIAAPFVVRTIRPDGLTRKFTAGVEYKISF